MAIKSCGAVLAFGLGFLGSAGTATAQSPAATALGDWPNLGAFNNRQNRNVNPYAYTSGRTFLRYTNISALEDFASVQVDDTDLRQLEFSRGGPQDDPLNTAVDPTTAQSLSFATPYRINGANTAVVDPAAWPAIATNADEASFAIVPLVRSRGVNVAYPTFDFAQRDQQYRFATCVPSAKNSDDPTQAATGTVPKYFEWRIVPPATNDRYYALYANVPDGPTTVTLPGGGTSQAFALASYVYEIRFGRDANNDGLPDNRVVSVVNTFGGSNRLGVTANRANPVFPSNGTPIVVRLYNTVPRDPATGALILPDATAGDSPANEAIAAAQRVVYADATTTQPLNATATTVATTTTVTGNTVGAPPTLLEDVAADWDVTLARNDLSAGFLNGVYATSQNGTVVEYQANPARFAATDNVVTVEDDRATPIQKWRYSLAQESTAATSTVDSALANSTNFTNGAINPYFIGGGYLVANATNATTGPPANPVPAPTASASYAPDLADGDYAIYAYLPGNYPQTAPTEAYATEVRYEIKEGPNVSAVSVDQSQARGWVRIGTRRFTSADTLPLTVTVTNYSPSAAGAQKVYADAIRFVGTSSLSVTSTPVHATVRIANAPADRTDANGDTRVVIVADEGGVIHCLDAQGRGDGTTTEYWRYPSLVRDANYRDPNLSVFGAITATPTILAGPDGNFNTAVGANNGPSATMPNGFNLGTAAVARVDDGGTARDLLYIGATNGRVYCLDMAGRGDFVVGTRTPGTTARRWTFPDDYNPAVPTSPKSPPLVGGFGGSVAFADPGTAGAPRPTVYAAAAQGRVYALNALGPAGGSDDAGSSRSTTSRWAFPLAAEATLPTISMTPTYFRSVDLAGRVLFGTQIGDATDDGPGQLYCLDANDGAIAWQINGTTYPVARYVGGTTANVRTLADYLNVPFDSFVSGPAAVDKATLDQPLRSVAATGTPTPNVDTAYVLNDNGYLYGLRMADGTLLTNADNDRAYLTPVNTLSTRSLTYTVIRQNNRARTGTVLEYFPSIVVPGVVGNASTYFARVDDYTGNDDYQGIGRAPRTTDESASAINAASASNNFLLLTDAEGGLFAYDDVGRNGGNLGIYPGGRDNDGPNDPRGRPYRRLRIRLLNKAGYDALKQSVPDPSVNGGKMAALTYNQALDATYARGGNPYAFEWGETAYILVYGFPYTTTYTAADGTTKPVDPATIFLTVSSQGKTPRRIPVPSRKFRDDPGNALDDPPLVDVLDQATDNPDNLRASGFALYWFNFGNGPQTSLPPGPGKITATISTGAVNGTMQEFTPDRVDANTFGDTAQVDFLMANPLAIVVSDPNTGNVIALDSGDGAGYSIGNTTTANNEANLVNGTPSLAQNATITESQLQATTGTSNHGTTGVSRVYVIDRSLMTLVREDGLGNLRLARTNLRRQGGGLGIYRPLPAGIYPGFEDAPVKSPNTSLDYPDIGREQVRAQANSNGGVENPVTTSVSLRPPTAVGGAKLTQANLGSRNERAFAATPLDILVEVPRYQPPVNTNALTVAGAVDTPTDFLHLRRDARGTVLPQGYFGRLRVFVDSNSDGRQNEDAREVYRSFNLSSAVAPQVSILVGSPSVDLGSLASGTGYSPTNPAGAELSGYRPFNPWGGDWADAYRGFSVLNDGNVNLIDLRLAKGTNETNVTGDTRPWALTSADNDPLAWMAAIGLDGNGRPTPGDLWSNIDTTYSAANPLDPIAALRDHAVVVLPKPRVTDRVSTSLVANPYPRANPNLRINAATGTVVDPSTPLSTGIVAVDGSPALRLDKTKPPSEPKIGVSVPLGFPVGNYSTPIRIVENFYSLPSGSAARTDIDNQILQYANGAYDAYSDPITLTYKVRETRMTNGTTPRTAPVVDPPSAVRSRNAAPAATRLADGSLIVGWESNRVSGANAATGPLEFAKIYLAGLRNSGATFSATGSGAPARNAPLWDLSQFAPAGGSWFSKNDVGIPASPVGLFSTNNLVDGTVRFGSPSFAARGVANPLRSGPIAGNGLGAPIMAFVGEAQVRLGAPTPTARAAESKVFVAPVALANDGTPSIGGVVATNSDPLTAKGKPSVLQLPRGQGGAGSGALVFYAETSAGQSGITADRLRASGDAFAAPVALNFGDGFSSVFSPSATARTYHPGQNDSAPIVELSFAGKLRGRPNAEAYLGRLRLGTPLASDPNDGAYAPTDPGELHLLDGRGRTVEAPRSGSPFVYLPVQTSERLLAEGNGTYRARGTTWNRSEMLRRIQDTATFPFSPLVQNVGTSATPTDLIVRSTAVVDRQSGLIACESRLGGKVYLDPELGTVRFTGGFPNRNAAVRLTYQPTFLRVTPGGTASYSAINGMFDDRFVSEYDGNGNPATPDYWFTGNNAYTNVTGSFVGTVAVRHDRFLFAYGRGASGGNTARPYATSLRIGLRLPTRVATDERGNVLGIQVSGNTKPYQVDPANGRVYFQAEDEDRNVQITYTGVNEATNRPTGNVVVAGAPSFVLERDEAPIPVDEAANDSALTAFLDPFTFLAGNSSVPRPPLVWLFYVSTRAGTPDVFFQTIAPRYTPFAK